MIAVKEIFNKENNILIGMIHLPPLLSFEGFTCMEHVIDAALTDLATLEQAGFDGALIENDNDKPHSEFANEAQIASFSVIANEVCKKASIPIGVQMMLNDWRSSLSIARVTGARFTRLDVFVDHMNSEWGEIHPVPAEINAYKNQIYPDILLLTDIQVKYKTMIAPRPLVDSAALAIDHKSNGIIITGEATGSETPIKDVQLLRERFPHFPIFVGSGINEANVQEQLLVANGAIVGTSIKTGDYIDLNKASKLVLAIHEQSSEA